MAKITCFLHVEQHTKRTNNSDATNQTDWHKDYFTAVKYTSATHKNKYKGKNRLHFNEVTTGKQELIHGK